MGSYLGWGLVSALGGITAAVAKLAHFGSLEKIPLRTKQPKYLKAFPKPNSWHYNNSHKKSDIPKNSISLKQLERQENYNRMKIGNAQNKLQNCWLKP